MLQPLSHKLRSLSCFCKLRNTVFGQSHEFYVFKYIWYIAFIFLLFIRFYLCMIHCTWISWTINIICVFAWYFYIYRYIIMIANRNSKFCISDYIRRVQCLHFIFHCVLVFLNKLDVCLIGLITCLWLYINWPDFVCNISGSYVCVHYIYTNIYPLCRQHST